MLSKASSLSKCTVPSPTSGSRASLNRSRSIVINEYEKAGNRALKHCEEDKQE